MMIEQKNTAQHAFLLASTSQEHDAIKPKKSQYARSQRLLNNQYAQQKGQKAEQNAQQLLESNGFQCVGKRLRSRFGEIDLAMAKGKLLILVEVRYRQNSQFGGAAASINDHKWRRIILTAQYWLKSLTRHYFHGNTPFCRFDVVTQTPEGLSWLQDVRQLT